MYHAVLGSRDCSELIGPNDVAAQAMLKPGLVHWVHGITGWRILAILRFLMENMVAPGDSNSRPLPCQSRVIRYFQRPRVPWCPSKYV